MRTGNLPSRDGAEINTDYNHDDRKIMIEINGEKMELSIVDVMGLICKLSAMVEVVLTDE